ncbi:MAG: tripartite tricarboxylate transporter TctB family protein, partial [Burkholderiaceae bacterium]
MKHVDTRDLFGGLILIALGAFVSLYAANHYVVGQAERMGPGYFPVALGWLLAILGLVVALFAFKPSLHHTTPPKFRPRPFFAILLSVAAFAFTVSRFGLVPGTVLLTVIAVFAEPGIRWRRTILLALSLSLLAWLI